jgi:hypothetical protein
MAIATRFDLDLFQYDVANAFVNADLNEEIYMRMPPGYRTPDTVVAEESLVQTPAGSATLAKAFHRHTHKDRLPTSPT